MTDFAFSMRFEHVTVVIEYTENGTRRRVGLIRLLL